MKGARVGDYTGFGLVDLQGLQTLEGLSAHISCGL